jgi:hypothetical protein
MTTGRFLMTVLLGISPEILALIVALWLVRGRLAILISYKLR